MVLKMNFVEFIDLDSDGEVENGNINMHSKTPTHVKISTEAAQGGNLRNGSVYRVSSFSAPCETSAASPSTYCQQFWKAGDYKVVDGFQLARQDGKNRIRVHPKFLHSNATSHKWVFGAIAELLDNAVDEVQKGATYVAIDKIAVPRHGPALVIQDDGGGMNPASLRSCISFGFSDKKSNSSIGQYGNGFKTSTMRLGADVIVFSCCLNNRILTQSIGLLSYTFLRQTGSDDVVVPLVDYEVDTSTGSMRKLIHYGERHFASNLSAILKWSPFAAEDDLLKQFDGIGEHGTKVMVFNLWLNDDGVLELDFDLDDFDIMLNGAPKVVGKRNTSRVLTEKHIANQLRYSLRAYLSVLYLHLPQHFEIILRGSVVLPHSLVGELQYIECIKYCPQVEGYREEVITTIGFLKGSPDLNIHGFNVYYRNRLILPFWRVVNNTNNKGRGVSGVLEANFIKPTHDKQDFEKSTLYCKLETRLKEMTVEYWNYHCHLMGYVNTNKSPNVVPHRDVGRFDAKQVSTPLRAGIDKSRATYIKSVGRQVVTALQTPVNLTPGGVIGAENTSFQKRHAEKRRWEENGTSGKSLKRLALANSVSASQEYNGITRGRGTTHQQVDVALIMQKNKTLRLECRKCEETQKELTAKVEKLRSELKRSRHVHERLKEELDSLDEVKVEKCK